MIRCGYTTCEHNKDEACTKWRDAVLDEKGGCILAAHSGDGSDDPPWLIKTLCGLRLARGYPFDFDKDRRFLQELRLSYPTVNLIDAVKAWRTYLLDNPPGKRGNYRSRFRRWCSNAAQWQEGKKKWRPEGERGKEPLPRAAMAPRDCTACSVCGAPTTKHEIKVFGKIETYRFYTCHCEEKKGGTI